MMPKRSSRSVRSDRLIRSEVRAADRSGESVSQRIGVLQRQLAAMSAFELSPADSPPDSDVPERTS